MGEIDLLSVLRRLWLKKWFIAAFFVAGLLLGVIYLKEQTPTYTAVLRVTPASSSGGGMQNRLRGLGGLAAAAGLTALPSDGASPFDLYLDAFQAQDLARDLANDPRIMQSAFAGEWDPATQSWREPSGVLKRTSNAVKGMLGFPESKWRQPDGPRLRDYLMSSILVVKGDDSPITQIVFDHRDPAFATYLLTRLNAAADRQVRRRALEQATQYAKYLSMRMATTPVAEHRQVLASSLSEQERSIMMASSSVPYAATVVEPPFASAAPTKPKAGMALVAASFGLALIGIFLALFDVGSIARAISGKADDATQD